MSHGFSERRDVDGRGPTALERATNTVAWPANGETRITAKAPRPPARPQTARPASTLVSLLDPMSFEAEQYRALRHVVDGLRAGQPTKVLAITSPTVGDGKTTTAVNFAVTLAQQPGRRVLLVDADLRRSAVSQRLGLVSPRLGLSDAIEDPVLGLPAVTQWHARAKLWLLPAGRPPVAPYLALMAPRLAELLDEARRSFDCVVLDTPPLLPVADCRALVEAVDCFLLVVAAHKTPRRLVADALAALGREKTLGIVFNGDDHQRSRHYRRYYYAYDHAGRGESRPSFWRSLLRRRRPA